jgi:hypothetical protein
MLDLSRMPIAVPHDEASGAPFPSRPGRRRRLVIGPAASPALAIKPLPTISVAKKVKRRGEEWHCELVSLTEWLRKQIWLAEAIAAANRPNDKDAWRFSRQHVVIEKRLRTMFAWQIETLVHGLNDVYADAHALCRVEGDVITIFDFSKAKTVANRAAKRAAPRPPRHTSNSVVRSYIAADVKEYVVLAQNAPSASAPEEREARS